MGAVLEPPGFAVAEAVARALEEDLVPLGDVTSALLPAGPASADVVIRAPGVLAGVPCAMAAFLAVDPGIAVTWTAADGDRVSPGQRVGSVVGELASILTAERTALNFLGHLSGIATLTRRFVDAVVAAAGDAAPVVWDTRKTTPGLRSLEKAAVRAGGGANHRGNLSEWVMLKDNHLTRLGIPGAVSEARRRWPGRTVQVECDRLDQVSEAVAAGADLVLLDNMGPDQLRACVAESRRHSEQHGGRTLLEASGGITLETVGEIATTGVDLVSVGAITNSAPVLDIGLDIDPSPPADVDPLPVRP